MKNTLKTLLITTALLSLSGCFDSDNPKQEAKKEQKYLEFFETRKTRPLNVKTASGSYLIAQHAQYANDWESASIHINKFIGENPSISRDYRDLLEKRAMVLNLGAGKIDGAHYYAKNLSEEEKNPLSVLVSTLPHIRKNDFKKAQESIDSMSSGGMADLIKPIIKNWMVFGQEETPKIVKNLSGQGLYHLILGADYSGDRDYLKKVIDVKFTRTGLNAQSLIDIADIMVRNGYSGRALSLYQDIQSKKPDHKELNVKISLLESGDDLPQSDLFKKIKNPEKGAAMAILDVGMLLFREQSLDSARIFAHLALNLDPELEDANLLLAYVAAQYEQYDEAIAFFKTITENDFERFVQAQMQVSELQEYAGRSEEALKTLEKVARLEDSIELQMQIGDLARSHDDYKRALKAYNAAFDMIGDDTPEEYWGLYYSRGIIYERLNDWDKAEQDLQQALTFEPNHPYVLNYLGYSWADQGKNLDDALSMISKAVSLRPDDGYIVDSLGWVYFKLGEYNRAVDPLENAVELLPEDPTVNDHLGDAYWKVGRKHEARFQWSRALSFAENAPDSLTDTEAQDLLGQLEKKLKAGL